MTVRRMNWKKGWIYGQGWMWFQWSTENLLRHFTWRCGSFSLLMGLLSNGIMWCGVLLLCWRGLVFGPNWGYIECLHRHSDGLVKVLDIYGNHSRWVGFYGAIKNSRYLTVSKSMLLQIWSWRYPWWMLNVVPVEYMKVFHTTKKMKTFILLNIQILYICET